jgi:hypothetical protein
VAGIGTDGVVISGNLIRGHTGTLAHGVKVGTFDNVGFIKNVAVTGNIITGNEQYGVIVQTNATVDATHGTSLIAVSGGNVVTGNGQYGIALGSGLTSAVATGNVVQGNSAGDLLNNASGGTSMFLNAASSAVPVGASGSFTPGLAGDGTAGTPTITVQQGTYTKTGNRVFFDLILVWTAAGGATGNWTVTGLPFTSDTVDPSAVPWAAVVGLTVTGQVFLLIQANVTRGLLYVQNNGGSAALPVTGNTAGTLRVSGSYRTAL